MEKIAFAAVGVAGRGATDRLLALAVARLQAQGLRLAGTVQTNAERPGRHACDMDIQVLPDGPALRISQDLGAEARGCRLDMASLEEAVALVETRLAGADMLVVNKFGKAESQGRGMVPVIARALDLGLPVLVGVNALNRPELVAFAGPWLQELPPDPGQIVAWALAQRALAA